MSTTNTTKSVLGMIKTAARRPLGGMQTAWMVCHPTLDALWFARVHREFELRIRRTAREGGAR